MIKIDIIYDHWAKKATVYANGDKCKGMEYLEDRELGTWFEPFQLKDFRREGFITELERSISYTKEEMFFYFYGEPKSKNIFEGKLKELGANIAKEEDSVVFSPENQQDFFSYAEKQENQGNIEEAKQYYKKAGDAGSRDGLFSYARLSEIVLALPIYATLAEENYELAQLSLAQCYRMGIGTVVNEQEAVKWYEKAAELGVPEAQYYVGCYCKKGEIAPKDEKRARELFQKSGESNFSLAQLELGSCYFHGKGVEEDKAAAVLWWEKASEQDIPEAMFYLGQCYEKGKGVAENLQTALELWEKAANAGMKEAQRKVGEYYDSLEEYTRAVPLFEQASVQGDVPATLSLMKHLYFGLGTEENKEKFVDLYCSIPEPILSLPENAIYRFLMGQCYFDGATDVENKEEALTLFQSAGDDQYTEALIMLGHCYYYGHGMEKSDKNLGLEWYQKASEQEDISEDIPSLLKIADFYDSLKKKDFCKLAYPLYLQAAELGSAQAQYKLGVYHKDKIGGAEWSWKESALWHEKAAKQGHCEAQYELARHYGKGKDGWEINLEKAFQWYEKARAQRHEKAHKEVVECHKKGKGTPEDLARAKQLEDEWQSRTVSYDK